MKAFRARRRGEVWSNPYDLGYRRNWQHVFGPGNVVLALLPRSVLASSQHPGPHTYRIDACTTVRVAAGSQAFRRILAKIFGRAALVSGTFSAADHGARPGLPKSEEQFIISPTTPIKVSAAAMTRYVSIGR